MDSRLKFVTFGPFQYVDKGNQSIPVLFQQVKAANPELEFGRGVYVFSLTDEANNITPFYVGKSIRHGFGGRVCAHLKKPAFKALVGDPRTLTISLVAAVGLQDKVKTDKTLTISEARVISALEEKLIQVASANQHLLNKRGKVPAELAPKNSLTYFGVDQLDAFANAESKI